MKILLNFAHPLGEKARKQIEEKEGEFQEIKVTCQFDLSGARSLSGQMADIEAGGHNVRLTDAYMVIVPALSSAAALLFRDLSLVTQWPPPKIVWLKRGDSPLPHEFILGGIE